MSTPIPDLLALSATLTDVYEASPDRTDDRVLDVAAALKAAHARIEELVRERDAANTERARMQRMLETMPPWRVSEPPTDEELRAIRLRWATGPERYQSDADALIAAVMQYRRKTATLTEELDRYRNARA